MKLNEKLISLRKEKGISQEELGNIINVSRQSISKWENGQAVPEIDKIKELSKVYDVSYEYLLNEEKNEKKKVKKEKNKNRILLFVVLIILVLYLITVLYKWISICRFKKIANSFSEENYEIYIEENKNGMETITYDLFIEDIWLEEIYYLNENEEKNNENLSQIEYADYNQKSGYLLTKYEDKYLYEELNSDNFDNELEMNEFYESKLKANYNTIDVLNTNMFMVIFNPLSTVSNITKTISIRTLSGVRFRIELNDNFLIKETEIKNDEGMISRTNYSYDYVQEHFNERKIENPVNELSDKVIYDIEESDE